MNGDGLVPKNPFASKLQSAFAHANPSKFGGKKGLAEWENDNKVMTNSLCWILAIGAVCIFALQWMPWLWN